VLKEKRMGKNVAVGAVQNGRKSVYARVDHQLVPHPLMDIRLGMNHEPTQGQLPDRLTEAAYAIIRKATDPGLSSTRMNQGAGLRAVGALGGAGRKNRASGPAVSHGLLATHSVLKQDHGYGIAQLRHELLQRV
jgi:hypothetical protein